MPKLERKEIYAEDNVTEFGSWRCQLLFCQDNKLINKVKLNQKIFFTYLCHGLYLIRNIYEKIHRFKHNLYC